ncbi:MAG TPA: tRNA (adenosine(37)-N6)-threonylcarbamoyltransferase complex dimerization subunit type 1 TsaB [Pyrinomonadaceae bacterium]|nr:tRNA (adenosine(37)-N6)-threonylcarbamoyltransferase complex dimerization subunit type 1 TsaB [Pyrinomonadaceae bacterium]
MSRPLILSVETATLAGSVAIARGDEILGVVSGDAGVSHSNTLLGDIDQLLTQTQLALREIDLFAVATGPGSFTGLRIGIATIKALSATLDRPVAGVPTLEAVALSGGVSDASVALLPAGRGEVFTQLFSVSAPDAVQARDEAAHIPPAQLFERYGQLENVMWCGEGAIVNRELIESRAAGGNWKIAAQTGGLAVHVAKLALAQFKRDQVDNPFALRAIYVRPADAQLKA